MTRELATSTSRCLTVWLLVSAGGLAVCSTVVGAAGSLVSSPVWRGTFEDLLVAIASAVLVACSCWLWLVTTATVVHLVRGARPVVAPRGRTHRLVLAACGAAVLAGAGGPAWAGVGPGDGIQDHSLVGLPMPDRAVASAGVRPAPTATTARPAHRRTPPANPAAHHRLTVRPGDSLWSIAAEALGPGAGPAEIDAAWRALYAANRDAIGADPDLIRPGLDLTTDPNRKARP